MGVIVKEHGVTGNRGSDTVRVLYDTGAGSSFVRRDIADILGDTATAARPMRFMMADGQEGFTADRIISLDIDVGGTSLMYPFYAVEDLAEELIIGADMMRKWKITLDLDNEAVSIDPRALYLNMRA